MSECTPRSHEVNYRPTVHYWFNYHVSGSVVPGYNEPSKIIDDVRGSLILNGRQQACFRKQETDEKYKHLAASLCTFLFWNLHYRNLFLSRWSVLFLQETVRVCGTAAAVTENDLMTNLKDVWDKAMQLNDEPLALSYFAQNRTYLLKERYTIPAGFMGSCEHHQGFGAAWISRTHLMPPP